MATKEEEFKVRFATVMADIGETGRKDPEAMLLIGSLASTLVNATKRKNWGDFKQKMTTTEYAEALSGLQTSGNQLHADGKTKQAYAAQALGCSIIASTQDDPEVREWAKVLDGVIERALAGYRGMPGRRSVN